MKTKFLGIPALLMLVMTSPNLHAQGSTTATRDVKGFNEIEIGGAFDVTLVQGNTEGVKITASEGMMSKIITKVDGNELKIYTQGENRDEGKMELVINFINVHEIECSGAITLKSSGPMKFNNLDLETSGTSKSELNLTADKLDIDISGTASATLTGTAKIVDLDISGVGKLKADELSADNYKISISGSGNADVYAGKTLDVSVSGAGVVRYKGEPTIKESISGSGKISKL